MRELTFERQTFAAEGADSDGVAVVVGGHTLQQIADRRSEHFRRLQGSEPSQGFLKLAIAIEFPVINCDNRSRLSSVENRQAIDGGAKNRHYRGCGCYGHELKGMRFNAEPDRWAAENGFLHAGIVKFLGGNFMCVFDAV